MIIFVINVKSYANAFAEPLVAIGVFFFAAVAADGVALFSARVPIHFQLRSTTDRLCRTIYQLSRSGINLFFYVFLLIRFFFLINKTILKNIENLPVKSPTKTKKYDEVWGRKIFLISVWVLLKKFLSKMNFIQYFQVWRGSLEMWP